LRLNAGAVAASLQRLWIVKINGQYFISREALPSLGGDSGWRHLWRMRIAGRYSDNTGKKGPLDKARIRVWTSRIRCGLSRGAGRFRRGETGQAPIDSPLGIGLFFGGQRETLTDLLRMNAPPPHTGGWLSHREDAIMATYVPTVGSHAN